MHGNFHEDGEDCNEDACNKYLKFFQSKKFDIIECDNIKKLPPLSFELICFGLFNKESNTKVTFVLYLRIKTGMMFSAKISFNLFDITGRRILSTGSGIGIQNGTAQGSYSENSLMSDFLAKFDCEAEVENSSKNFQIRNLILEIGRAHV